MLGGDYGGGWALVLDFLNWSPREGSEANLAVEWKCRKGLAALEFGISLLAQVLEKSGTAQTFPPHHSRVIRNAKTYCCQSGEVEEAGNTIATCNS